MEEIISKQDEGGLPSLEEIKELNERTQRQSNETIHIGRETIQTLSEQNETLEHIETLTDYQSYILEKGDRTLRDMTWSGWLYNKFTSEPNYPTPSDMNNGSEANDNSTKRRSINGEKKIQGANDDDPIYDIPTYPEDLPKEAKPTAQSIQNYHCNILLLKHCTIPKEKQMCIDICERHKHNTHLCLQRFQTYYNDSIKGSSENENDYRMLLDSFSNTKMHLDSIVHEYKTQPSEQKEEKPNNKYKEIEDEQMNHIETISKDLQEITSLGKNINTMVVQQNEVISHVMDVNECNIEKTKLVNRRAERIMRRSQLRSCDPVLFAIVTIQYQPTKEFLSIDTSNDNNIIFNRKYSGIASRFSIWKIPQNSDYTIIGIQSCLTNKCITKSKWNSNIYCSGGSFQNREEFEIDASTSSKNNNDQISTMLMCCSANYGNGGYVVIQEQNNGVKKLVAASKDDINGALWQIQPISS